jgi:hypothetical protein
MAYAVATPVSRCTAFGLGALGPIAVVALLGHASAAFGPAAWMVSQAALGIVAAVAAARAPAPVAAWPARR